MKNQQIHNTPIFLQLFSQVSHIVLVQVLQLGNFSPQDWQNTWLLPVSVSKLPD